MSTCRARVRDALEHKTTDILPYQIDLTQEAWAKTARYLGDDGFMDRIGNHIADTYYSGDPHEVRPGYFLDDFGVLWNRTGVDRDIGVPDAIVIDRPSLRGYTLPQVPAARLHARCAQNLNRARDAGQFAMASIGFSLFERAWTLVGMENLLVYMITEPDFVHALMEAITAYNLDVLRIYLEYDFDGIHFGDDWGQQKGLIMGPALWRTFIRPYLGRMYAAVKAQGRFVSQHSCGDIGALFDDLIALGLDVYQTFQPEIYDIRAVKAAYGDRLCFWGGISTQRLLPFETPEGVVRKSREIMDIMGRGGGYIAAPTHSIPGDVPPENIVALIELFRGQGG